MPDLRRHLPRFQPRTRRLLFFTGLTLVVAFFALLVLWYRASVSTAPIRQTIVITEVITATPVATFTLPAATITDLPQASTATPTIPAPPTPSATPTPGSPGADRVLAFNPGPGAQAKYGDPEAVLGAPDIVENPCCSGMLQLGRSGSVLVAFTDNVIVDGDGPDLRIFGESAKDDYLVVEVSYDGAVWAAFPTCPESSCTLDLSDADMEYVRFIRLTDQQPGTLSGAEIDAIVALNNGPVLETEVPSLPDAVARTDSTLRESPSLTSRAIAHSRAGTLLRVLGRTDSGDWVMVAAASQGIGWCLSTDLKLNVFLSDYPVSQPPPTATATRSPTATLRPTATATRRPTATPTPTVPSPQWILVADSRTDYPGIWSARKWWYLFSDGRNNFNWQEMEWDDPNYCYRSPNDWGLRICADSITTDPRGDVAIQWKAAQGGTYRFEWNSPDLSFYMHLSYVGSQRPGTELEFSATIHDVIDWELFFWVARRSTNYHIRVYRLQE